MKDAIRTPEWMKKTFKAGRKSFISGNISSLLLAQRLQDPAPTNRMKWWRYGWLHEQQNNR